MDAYRHLQLPPTAPPNSNKVVRSIGAVIRRVDGLRELWDECSLDLILSRYYDPEILGLSQDTATVAVIEGLSSVGSKILTAAAGDASTAATAVVAIIEKLAERGIRPCIAIGSGGGGGAGLSGSPTTGTAAGLLSSAGGGTPSSNRSFYQALSETTDFALDHPLGPASCYNGLRHGGTGSHPGNRLRTMSDVPVHATNDLHHFTTTTAAAAAGGGSLIMTATTTEAAAPPPAASGSGGSRSIRRDSPSAVNVPQIDLDDLLSPPGTRQKALSALRNAVRGDLLGRVRQRAANIETGRQRSRSEMDARWLKGLSPPLPAFSPSGFSSQQQQHQQSSFSNGTKQQASNPSDLRPDWMRSPQYLKSIETKLDDPCLYYVEWNILGLQRALSMKKLSRVVSPRFVLNPNPNISMPAPSSLLLMISFCPRSSLTSPLYISISVSLPGEVEAKYRVFHPTYLSESRWHSFCQTPWATSDNVPLPLPLPDVLTVGVVIEALRPPQSPSATKCHTPPLNASSEHGPETLTSCPTSDIIGGPIGGSALQSSSDAPPQRIKQSSVNRGKAAYLDCNPCEKIESLPSLTDLINLAATSYTSTRQGGGTGGGLSPGPNTTGPAGSPTANNNSGLHLFLSTPPPGPPSDFSPVGGRTAQSVGGPPLVGESPAVPAAAAAQVPQASDVRDLGDSTTTQQEYEEHRIFELLQNDLFDAEDDFMSDDANSNNHNQVQTAQSSSIEERSEGSSVHGQQQNTSLRPVVENSSNEEIVGAHGG